MSSVIIVPIHLRSGEKGTDYFDPRHCRMIVANASHTGSSAVRGNGLSGAGITFTFPNELLRGGIRDTVTGH
jgi:hypothetical protein